MSIPFMKYATGFEVKLLTTRAAYEYGIALL
jgi:hypothetical protein